ncbi:MAG: sensor histidine kinase, partial [Bacteroidota bacterium]
QSLSQQILQLDTAELSNAVTFKKAVLLNEANFLKGMDNLVFAYEQEAKSRVKNLQFTESVLFAILIGILFLELFFIFRPAAKRTQQIVEELSESERAAQQIANENKVLFQEKEKSLKALQTLNFALDNAALYASLQFDGQLLYLSEKFKSLLHINNPPPKVNFAQLVTTDEGEQQYLNDLISTPRSSIWTEEIQVTTPKRENLWLELTIIPINQEGIQQDLLLLCNDLTLRKRAQLEVERLNKERFSLEIAEQKNRSIQVVQAQDEERKRIAKDMHDDIGQMLTALKFNLEAVNLNKPEKASKKLADIKQLAGDIIKSVRVATFNLTPPELSDYGISTGIAKLVDGLQSRTGKNILFENRTHFNARLETHTETNLYRITQEAVNNAIKYAQANYVLVILSHSDSLLSIVIDDDGVGFDTDNFAEKATPRADGSGMGLAFMQERVGYIDGRLFIRSAEGDGTRVTVNMPLASD